ncbi:MAG: hypothetical protein NZO16_04565 [Deltaproteobacteria bacterium]|nr:hypothetical protein [Deltaproteobacteria bacterium]
MVASKAGYKDLEPVILRKFPKFRVRVYHKQALEVKGVGSLCGGIESFTLHKRLKADPRLMQFLAYIKVASYDDIKKQLL